jgi:hypothetical protein
MPDSVLYFARGRGRGHALAAMAIAECLAAVRPNIEIRFVSYGTGAETLRQHGRPVLDLNLPDRPNPFAVERRLPRAFEQEPRPSLVVAHEEFDVPFAARQCGSPCVVATDWFLDDPEDWRMESLKHAVEILFLDEASGVFPEPEYIKGKVRYVGPVLRRLRYGRPRGNHSRVLVNDRPRARQEAGFPPDALIVSVFIHPGRRIESVAPLSMVLQQAFDSLEAPCSKLLLWDRDSDSDFDRIMAASDLAVTKGNRNIVLELAAMGVPAISVSHGLNFIDDIRTAPLPNNRTVSYADLDAAQLARLMREMIAKGAAGEIQPVLFQDGARLAAERLANWIVRPTDSV